MAGAVSRQTVARRRRLQPRKRGLQSDEAGWPPPFCPGLIDLFQGSNWREASRVYKAIVEQWQNTERDKESVGTEVSLKSSSSPIKCSLTCSDEVTPRVPLLQIRSAAKRCS